MIRETVVSFVVGVRLGLAPPISSNGKPPFQVGESEDQRGSTSHPGDLIAAYRRRYQYNILAVYGK